MGFPEWTLWGMGLAVTGALISITLSWLGQSPQMVRRLGLGGARLDLRVRAFTGYALALLLLSVAFFLAGVPLGAGSEPETLAQQDETPVTTPEAAVVTSGNENADSGPAAVTPATPETGAFSGPPASDSATEESRPPSPTIDAEQSQEAPSVEETTSITSTTGSPTSQPSPDATSQPTATATPLPTATPFPTLTPTAIAGETAVVNTGGSTLWLKRSPGGQNLLLIRNGDLVLLRSGHANQSGLLWREVATVAGVQGWLQAEFLVTDEAESAG
jgi:hypothetical protein